jgi:predicted permease
MSDVFTTVAPVFGLIVLGFLAARTRLLSEAARAGLTEFVFTIAVPMLIFRTIVTAAAPGLGLMGPLASFFGAVAIVWIFAAVSARVVLKTDAEDAASIGFSAGFGNVLILGIPIAQAHFGEQALAPMLVIVIVDVPLMWLVATLQIEWAKRADEGSFLPALGTLGRSLARNPIIISVFAGLIWRQTGFGVADIPDKMISLLAGAAIPGALFALGMTLSKFRLASAFGTLTLIVVAKLFFLPMVAFVLASAVFQLPPLWTQVFVIAAACPVGINAYLFAAQYDRSAGAVAGAIAFSTVLSAVTISVILALMGPLAG